MGTTLRKNEQKRRSVRFRSDLVLIIRNRAERRSVSQVTFSIFLGHENKNHETFLAYKVNFSIYSQYESLRISNSHLKTKFSNNCVCFLQPKNTFYHKIHKNL